MSFSLLGPMHHAPPATTSNLLKTLFSKSPKKSKSSKAPKIKSTLIISHERTASSSSSSSSYSPELPPPSYNEAIYSAQDVSEDITITEDKEEEDIIDCYFSMEEDEVERRMQEWDEEIKQKRESELRENDKRVSEGLKKMGF